ncbi:MFS monocarboxylate transporter [Xylogone sp. PMI_703]|nr:MFS monocarboxylate transporter [Xylogone sp. PMI_703]
MTTLAKVEKGDVSSPELSVQIDKSVPNSETSDGGLLAWSQVLASFFAYFATWGFVQSFGVYQAYYEITLLKTYSPSQISWIGSVESFLLVIGGVITGPVYDRGYGRSLIIVGTFLITFGMMMTSISKKYYQFMLAQGVCTGLGHSCLWVPSMAIVSLYFDKKRPLAMGLASTGGAIGGVIYPVIFHQLQPKIGFPWTVRIIAFITFAILIISLFITRPKTIPGRVRHIWDPTAARDLTFIIITIGGFFILMGAWVPWFYIQLYALSKTDAESTLIFYMLPIASAGSALGRIVPPALSLKTGPLVMLIICCVICAILSYCWAAIHSTAGAVVFSTLYGHFSGATVGISGAVIASVTPDPKLVGTRLGLCLGIGSIGLLIGNPIAGTMVNLKEGHFLGMQMFVASVLVASAIVLGVAATMLMRKRGTWRV